MGALVLCDRLRRAGVDLEFCDDARAFKNIVTHERARYSTLPDVQAVPSVIPLYNRHVDPDYRALSPLTFFALVDHDATRANPLRATATGSLYFGAFRDLLTSQQLWADRFEDRPFDAVRVDGDDLALDRRGYVSHCGTTWVDIEHRRKGIGAMMARLNVMCAWLKFGAWPIFGTVPVPSNLADTFGADRVIGRAYCDGQPTDLIAFTQQGIHDMAAKAARGEDARAA